MTLVCAKCIRLPDPLKGKDTDADDSRCLAFDLVATPRLTRIVGALQADLVAALAGVAPDRPGGILLSAGGLIDVVASLVVAIELGRNLRFERRVDWFATARSKPWAVAYELFTPADASVDCAFGLLGIAAAVLDSLNGHGEAGHRWKQYGVAPVITAASFMAWLDDSGRQWLRSVSRHWEPPLRKAFWAAVEGQTQRCYDPK
jgi:hypothetical protein